MGWGVVARDKYKKPDMMMGRPGGGADQARETGKPTGGNAMNPTASLALALTLAASAAFGDGVVHHVALHVDENDPKLMNMVLNNAQNLTAYYAGQGDTAEIEIVAYGPGLSMYVEGKSPVADRIAQMSLENEGLHFSACANTIAGMEKKTGEKVALLAEAEVVPSGVVRLIELQEQGYAYIRP